MPRCSRRRLLLAFAALPISSVGCGTILYPERRGQPKGQLDWGIVALDGIGLLLFFVPGVVAFAVDFATGAIYLPSDSYFGASLPGVTRPELMTLHVPTEDLTDTRLAAIVSRRLGRPIDLSAEACRRVPIEDLDQFWSTSDRLIAEYSAQPNPHTRVLRAQSSASNAD